MTEKKVFTVERDCMDPYFEAHTVAIFSTEEYAQAFIDAQSDKDGLNIFEWELDSVIQGELIDKARREERQ